ncbi:MAG: MarR family transcriptional regulator [Aeromicrobium sp.]|uniref:MarR family winged helix-turn-helix transcriptional regulator n=1 Tax=Aeromicrobium sp. TaxID=1871063 RepID=UPI0039E6ECA5
MAPDDALPTDTPWLSVEQQGAWRAFLGGVTALMDQLDRDLRQHHGLSLPEYEILVRLSEVPSRAIRMAELADAVGHSRSRVTHTVSRLERSGLVARGQCAEDGRGVSAVLTDAGFAVLERAAHTHVRGVHDYFVTQACPGDFATVGKVMAAVSAHLDARPF